MAAININTEQFDNMMNDGRLMLVDYWAPWCGYCRRIESVYEKIAQQYSSIIVAKVNIDEEPELADREQIKVIPTLVLYRDGKSMGFLVAPESKAKIDSFIRETLER